MHKKHPRSTVAEFSTSNPVRLTKNASRIRRQARSRNALLAMVSAFVAPSFMAVRPADALTPVSLTKTGTSAANPWGSLIWSDDTADNPGVATSYTNTSTGLTGTPSANTYSVGSGLTLYAPTDASGPETFYGGGLSLNNATLSFPGSSSSTVTHTYNFTNLPATGIQLTDSKLVFTTSNATTQTLNAGLVLADTGSNTNTISYTSTAYTQNFNQNGPITGSGTLAFTGTFSGNTDNHTFNLNNATTTASAFTGSIVLGTVSTAVGNNLFDVNAAVGNVSSYTIGFGWIFTNATAAAIYSGTIYNVSSGGTLAATGPTGYTTAAAWLSSGQILAGSAGDLALTASDSTSALNFTTNPSLYLGSDGAYTFSGTLTPGSNGYLLGGGTSTLTMGTLLTDNGAPTSLSVRGPITLTQANTFTGNTTVSSAISIGSILLSNSLALQNSTVSSVLTTKVLSFSSTATGTNDAFTLGGLSGSAPIALIDTASNGVTLSVGNNNTSTTFTGNINGTGGSFAKIGTGSLTVSGTNTYTGTTTISAGTLQFAKQVALYNNASGSWTASNITVNTGATLAVNAGGTGEFTASSVSTLLSGLSASSGGFLTGSIFAIDTTNAGGSFTYATPITNPNGGSNAMGLTKLGTGTLALTASNTYTGPTLVSVGTVAIDSSGSNTGSISTSAVTVSGGASLVIRGNTSTGAVSVAGGSTTATQGVLDLRDTTVNTLTVNGNLAFGTGSNGSVVDLDFGSSSGSNDSVSVFGNVSETGTTTINLNALGSFALGSYTLITDTGGGLAAGTGFTIGTHPIGFNYSLATSTADQLILTVTNGNPTPTTAYWTGLASAGSDPSNNWGHVSGATTNFSNVSSGTSDAGQVPGSITNVFFTAANATAVAGVLSTQLDNYYSINSLTFDTSPAPSITNVGIATNGYSLTIGSGGLTVASTDKSNANISGGASSLVLGATQTWANNASSYSLTVNAGITGTATAGATQTLTFAGNGSGGILLNGAITDGTAGGNLAIVFGQNGVTQLNGTNTFTGGVTINSGTIRLGNSSAFNSTSPNTITFAPSSTGDLQLNGNSLSLSSLNTNSTAIIENAGASPATLTINASSGTSTVAGVLQDGTGGGSLSLSLPGASTLVLSGSNAYTGTTTLGAGSTLMTTSPGAIPAGSSLSFTGAATLNTSSPTLTVAGLTVSGSTSFTPTLAGPTALTVNATGNTVIGATITGLTDTLDLSALSSFNYNGSAAAALILAGNVTTGGSGTLNLAANSTIKAGTLDLSYAPTSFPGGNGYTSTGILALGTTNVIDVNNIIIGERAGGTSTGLLSFASGLTNPTLTLAGYAGGSSAVSIVIGESVGSDYSFATGTVDLSAGSVNASIGTLSIGIHDYNNVNFNEDAIGSFTMGAGTVAASTIILGQTLPSGTTAGRTGSLGSGTFNLGNGTVSGGTLQVGTLTMGDQQKETTNTSGVTSIFNFNGGLLEAAVIQPGATQTVSAGTVTRTFNWNAGTIQNFNATTGLTISIPTITIASSGNQTFDITPGQTGTVSSNMSGGAIIKADSGTLILSGSNTYTGGTNVTGGTLSLTGATAFPVLTSLTIAPGATVNVARFNTSQPVTVAQISSLTNGGLLNVGSNALILQNPPAGTLGTIMSQLQSAYHNGNWNGTTGITSSAAAADTTHLTAVGVLINDTGANTGNSIGSVLYTSLDNAPTSDGDILVKYTYYGDANLSGSVDGSDYSLIDNGALNSLTGWYNGDFNYDGIVNGSDYTLIDNAFNTQTASLAGEIASPTAQIATGTAAVPEPATFSLLGVGAMGLLGRRRSRR